MWSKTLSSACYSTSNGYNKYALLEEYLYGLIVPEISTFYGYVALQPVL